MRTYKMKSINIYYNKSNNDGTVCRVFLTRRFINQFHCFLRSGDLKQTETKLLPI